MNEFVLGIGACIFLLIFFLTGIEIGFGIAVTGLVGYALLSGWDAAYNLLALIRRGLMILATPILFPAIPKLGYDPIWFGVMVGVTIMVGTIIPPVAIGVFVVKNITGESFGIIYAGVVPFLLSFVFVAALLFIFPQIATWLPYTIMGR